MEELIISSKPLLLQLDVEELLVLCRVSKRLKDICEDDSFWIQKLYNDFHVRYEGKDAKHEYQNRYISIKLMRDILKVNPDFVKKAHLMPEYSKRLMARTKQKLEPNYIIMKINDNYEKTNKDYVEVFDIVLTENDYSKNIEKEISISNLRKLKKDGTSFRFGYYKFYLYPLDIFQTSLERFRELYRKQKGR